MFDFRLTIHRLIHEIYQAEDLKNLIHPTALNPFREKDSAGRIRLRHCSRTSKAAIYCLAVLLLSGCSAGLSIFPTGQYVLDSANSFARSTKNTEAVNTELNKSVLPNLYVEPGDVLLVESPSFDSPIRFPADQTVLPDGTIDLGRYGRIGVAGMTLEQIETIVQDRVEQIEGELDPINVRMIDVQGTVYYVLGEVNAPGSYPLVGRESVLDGIVAAGGLSDRASNCEMILSRPTSPDGCRIVMPICYREIIQLGDTTTNYQLRPGDRIFVGTRGVMEELCFWKSRESCPNCGKRQCACADAGSWSDQPKNMQTHSPPMSKMPRRLPRNDE